MVGFYPITKTIADGVVCWGELALNKMKKSSMAADGVSSGGRWETNQTSGGEQNIRWGSSVDRRPSLMGFRWSEQPRWSPVRGRDDSDLVRSQLG